MTEPDPEGPLCGNCKQPLTSLAVSVDFCKESCQTEWNQRRAGVWIKPHLTVTGTTGQTVPRPPTGLGTWAHVAQLFRGYGGAA